ncbi:hypothetical protein PS666_002267 [Salmonella enterica]|nr:hypothetical protein [Salmonella enterica]EKL9651336.1 hypothetical protein [Salmonella enterica]
MSNIDKHGRQVQRYANYGVDMMEWAEGGYVKHSDYLALLDELEAREVKLPELKMLRDYLAEVTHREREDILVGVRLEFFRALEEAGVKVAAAGKGDAS